MHFTHNGSPIKLSFLRLYFFPFLNIQGDKFFSSLCPVIDVKSRLLLRGETKERRGRGSLERLEGPGRESCEVCRCERERGEVLLRGEEKKGMEGRKERDVKEK